MRKGLSFVKNDERQVFFMKRRQMTPEQRQRHNQYQRQYRQSHKDRVRQWRDAYTLRRAAKLLAAEQAGGLDAGT